MTNKQYVVQIRKKGQITLPKDIRKVFDLEEGEEVVLMPVGESIIFTKRHYAIEEIRKKVSRLLKSAGISPEEILKTLKEEKEVFSKELYEK
ncbi:MAG: AbrB/MazE/SpoVT family DNA-binding domain-containing protein [Desulfurellaceae bacterium]|jgi:AbrB family looped-hinge helix DNA binding protein|nr:AbrB/MazE/SpoVT family DNA-binding domain-containing protein [Desulfurellaceae bacterium]